MEISFLIPVYNQSEDLAKCISSIIAYKGTDIEIVVNDDCSEERLDLVVADFGDERIRWCRNDKNLGLDGNILSGIRNCRGKYIFLLRTTDYAIADCIPDIISIIGNHPDIVYITGTALDNDGLPRVFYDDKIYGKGEQALRIHDSIHFHPSGSIFKRAAIDIGKYQKYLERYPEKKFWFMVDQLIRLNLTQEGDFCLIGKPMWIYTYTNRNKKKSVHPLAGGRVYARENTFWRFQSEMEFVANEFKGELRIQRLAATFAFWLYQATWGYLDTVSDKGLMEHYGAKPEVVDVRTERAKFLDYAEKLERKLEIVDERYFLTKEENVQKNIEYGEEKQKIETRKTFVREYSLPVIKQIEKMKLNGNDLADCLLENGFNRIGIYGAGYLGRVVWNELAPSNKIKVVFISDRMYRNELPIGYDACAIPSEKLDSYDIDVLLITPIQHKDEILREITCKAPKIVISDLLHNEMEKLEDN